MKATEIFWLIGEILKLAGIAAGIFQFDSVDCLSDNLHNFSISCHCVIKIHRYLKQQQWNLINQNLNGCNKVNGDMYD